MFNKLNNSQLVRYLLLITLGWAIAQIIAYFQVIIIIFVFAGLLAFILSYPVQWLENYLSHGFAVCLVFFISILSFIAITITLGFIILSQGQQLIEQLPELSKYLINFGEELKHILVRFNIPVDLDVIQQKLRDRALSGIGFSLATLPGIFSNLLELILIAVVAFFMMLEGEKLWDFILNFFPIAFRSKLTIAVKRNFLGFFWGRLVLAVFFGISVFIIFIILQIPFALTLATINVVFDLIPGIGATLGIIMVALIILPQGVWLSLIILCSCIFIKQIEENLLMPKLMQESLDLNPVIMFFALLVGARIAGLVGIFLAIPIAGVIINLLQIDEIKIED